MRGWGGNPGEQLWQVQSAKARFTWLELELRARFSGRILFTDAAVAERWRLLIAEAEPRGRSLCAIWGGGCLWQPLCNTI
jgi:hypothetical protein